MYFSHSQPSQLELDVNEYGARRGVVVGPASAADAQALAPQAPAERPTAERPNNPSQHVTPQTSDDCGQCAMCLDKPRFGGPGIKRKGCLAKRNGGAALRAPVAIESEAG